MDWSGIRRVLVVGGGIGGMSAAIALRRAGIAVDLVDLDPNWRALGAGLTLNGATLRALDRLGVHAEVVRRGHVHGGRRSHRSDGTVIADLPAYVPEPGDLMSMGGILRPVLHSILADRVRELGCRVRLGLSVDALPAAGAGVRAEFGDGTTGIYDLVVGSDGIASHVRGLIMPDAPGPRFTGQGCWRALFPRPAEVATNWLFVDPDRKIGLNPVSHDSMYMFLLESAPGNPWRDPADWPAMLAQRMRGYGGLVAELASRIDERASVNYRPLETLLVDPPWHRGRVVLLGDAAHATTPHAGYGAGLAMEDGIVLADELGRHRDPEDALVAFSTRRYERCRAVLEGSIALGELEMRSAAAEEQVEASARLFAIARAPF